MRQVNNGSGQQVTTATTGSHLSLGQIDSRQIRRPSVQAAGSTRKGSDHADWYTFNNNQNKTRVVDSRMAPCRDSDRLSVKLAVVLRDARQLISDIVSCRKWCFRPKLVGICMKACNHQSVILSVKLMAVCPTFVYCCHWTQLSSLHFVSRVLDRYQIATSSVGGRGHPRDPNALWPLL